MNKAISPEEVINLKADHIPDEVFDAWNSIIAQNWNGHRSFFKLKELVDTIKIATGKTTHEEIKKEGWLDLEPIYRAKGWKVEYQPGYNETYDAFFEFTK